MMKYKGYKGYVEFDADADTFHGEVLDIRDVITFQGRTVREPERAFKDSVDEFLSIREERREEPDEPFSGKFVLRLSPELHHRA
jgi:predicted HicB family RNase H-like nuclease